MPTWRIYKFMGVLNLTKLWVEKINGGFFIMMDELYYAHACAKTAIKINDGLKIY